jgi:uncharacterized protein (TIGR03790 family)
MTRRAKQLGPSGLILLLTLLAALMAPADALALAAADLIIVYNRTRPESREVAVYYAEKRRVPSANLVGVEVPFSEDMSRQDYDQKLAPPVRQAAARLRDQGRTPAVLLVYGIPLRVGPVAATAAETAFQKLAAGKVREYQQLVEQEVQRLDGVTGAAPAGASPPRPLTRPVRQTLSRARESFLRGTAYLDKQPATSEQAETRAEVMNLLVSLGGTSPEARALMAKMARSRGQERQALGRQELLGLNAVVQGNVQEEMFRGILPENALEIAASIRFTNGLMGELKFWEDTRLLYAKRRAGAAVDSELTLIMAGRYQAAGWLPNPFNLGFERLPGIARIRARTLMVGRLDGPTPAIARRLVDDALEGEKTGLSGVFYLDARGLTGQAAPGNYVWFDRHLLRLADLLRKYSDMKVVLDKQPGVLPPGSCPDAALYCGWYSLGKYVPAFTWKRGAVAYHVASAEATTLRRPGATVWCKRLLEAGVAATLGPVAEPYLISFPLPDRFFPLLMTGKSTLLEVYFHTVPQVSWMQILIGDPLYQPFKGRPALRVRISTRPEAPEPD